jgi:hypothetical protein
MKTRYISLILITTILSLLFIYLVFLEARPFYLTLVTDIETDYYYNSKLMFYGVAPVTVVHPGFPIFWIGSMIFQLFEPTHSIQNTQLFFNIGYCTIFLATLFAFWYFVLNVLKDISVHVALLVVVSILIWPPFIFYFNRFGADAFILPVTLMSFSILWKILSSYKINTNLLRLCGLFLGLGLSIKFSTLLSFAIVVFVSSLHIFLSDLTQKQKIIYLKTIPLWTLLAFLIFMLPGFHRWPQVLYKFYILITSGELLKFSDHGISMIFVNSIMFILIGILATSIYFLFSKKYFRNMLSSVSALPTDDINTIKKEGFDDFSATIFILFLLLSFIFLVAIIPNPGDYGVLSPFYKLRNASSAALFLPFMIIHLNKIYFEPRKKALFNDYLLGIVAIVALTLIVSKFISNQNILTNTSLINQKSTHELIEQYYVPGKKIAFYMEHPGLELGEESFHFWGNYKQANGFFDKELVTDFPKYSQINMGVILEKINESDKQNETSSAFKILKDLLPENFQAKDYENYFTDNINYDDLSAIIISKYHLFEKFSVDLDVFLAFINDETGLNKVSEVKDGQNIDYFVIQ